MAQYSRQLAKGLKWYYKFTYEGKTYFSKCIYETKKEARIAEAEQLRKLQLPIISKGKALLLDDLINSRLEYLKARKTSKYYNESERYLSFYRDYLGNIEVQKITRKEVSELMNAFIKSFKNGKGNYAVNHLLRAGKALFNHGINLMNLEMINPCVGVKFFSIRKKIKYIPTDDEIEAVKKTCNPKQSLLIDFCCQTGARASEFLRITWGDVYEDYIVLYTQKSYNSNLMPRKVLFPECLKKIRKGKKDERIFKEWKVCPDFLKLKVKKLGQNRWGFHNLRHRYASTLSKQGKPIFELMNLLGHSNLSTTQIYLQLL